MNKYSGSKIEVVFSDPMNVLYLAQDQQTDAAAVANRYLINSLSQRSPLVGQVVWDLV